MSERKLEVLKKNRLELKKEEKMLLSSINSTYIDNDSEMDLSYNQELFSGNSIEYDLYLASEKINEVDEQIGSIKRDLFLKENYRKLTENSSLALNQDVLDREELAIIIANMVNQLKKDEKISFAILGEWGSGKSTLLNFISSHIKKENTFVQFKASRYDDQEQIWYSLLHEVSEKYLTENKVINKTKFIWKSFENKLSLLCVFIFFLISFHFMFYYPSILSHFIGQITIILSVFTGLLSFKLFGSFYDSIKIYFLKNSLTVRDQLKYPNYKNLLGTRDKVYRDLISFKDLLRDTKKGNLVIFIDELDRCSEKSIINFFSSIETFIDIPGISFIFSINPEVVYPIVSHLALTEQNNLSEKEKTKLGAEYIEKYTDLSLTLLQPSSYTLLIESMLDGLISENDIKQISTLVNRLLNSHNITPRQIKKILDTILIYSGYFPDLIFIEFATIFLLSYYYDDFLLIFNTHNQYSQIQLNSFPDFNLNKDNIVNIPDEIIDSVRAMLKETNMYCIHKSLSRIQRISQFI